MSSAVSVSTSTIQDSLPVVFLANESYDRVKEKTDPDTAWYFYSHSVTRDVKNLSMLVHRIFFAMEYKGGDFLPASLHDLFYVLKDAGEPLRLRLLKAAAPYLDRKDLIFFAGWIKASDKKKWEYHWVTGSVLAIGLPSKDHALVTKTETEMTNAGHEHSTPLEEAQSYIEYGQLDLAEKTLKNALLVDTNNVALRKELDNLYRYIN